MKSISYTTCSYKPSSVSNPASLDRIHVFTREPYGSFQTSMAFLSDPNWHGQRSQIGLDKGVLVYAQGLSIPVWNGPKRIHSFVHGILVCISRSWCASPLTPINQYVFAKTEKDVLCCIYFMQSQMVLHFYLYTHSVSRILDNIPMSRLRQTKKWALEGMHSCSSSWRAIWGRDRLLQDGHVRLVVCKCRWCREAYNLWI